MSTANVSALITIMLDLLQRSAALGALITQARAEGRDISSEELDDLVAADQVARAELEQAIEDAKAAESAAQP